MGDDYSTPSSGDDSPDTQSAKPPFGYYGAKQRIAQRIISSLPPHNAWVEAFCGSAAITLAKPPAPIEVINDLDDQIVNLFKQLRRNRDALCRAVALTPYARAEFQKAHGGGEPGPSGEGKTLPCGGNDDREWNYRKHASWLLLLPIICASGQGGPRLPVVQPPGTSGKGCSEAAERPRGEQRRSGVAGHVRG